MTLLTFAPAAGKCRRIYPLSPRDLSEEQIAVTFAMTSRNPEPFAEIARRVSAERAADFNERWVVGYGHSSVAEHAVVHLAVENISRLACDGLEDNRLASYTEKSSRYQVIDADSFHIPQELDAHPARRAEYIAGCQGLFDAYRQLLDGVTAYLRRGALRQGSRDGDGGDALRARRCRSSSRRQRWLAMSCGLIAEYDGGNSGRAGSSGRRWRKRTVAAGWTWQWATAARILSCDCMTGCRMQWCIAATVMRCTASFRRIGAARAKAER